MNAGIRVIAGEMVGLIRARRREESRAVFVLFRDREASSVRFSKVRNDLGTKKKEKKIEDALQQKFIFHFSLI